MNRYRVHVDGEAVHTGIGLAPQQQQQQQPFSHDFFFILTKQRATKGKVVNVKRMHAKTVLKIRLQWAKVEKRRNGKKKIEPRES